MDRCSTQVLRRHRFVGHGLHHIGAGDDPWGGYRRGFEGRTSFALADFGIKRSLGPDSREVNLWLGVEGIRK